MTAILLRCIIRSIWILAGIEGPSKEVGTGFPHRVLRRMLDEEVIAPATRRLIRALVVVRAAGFPSAGPVLGDNFAASTGRFAVFQVRPGTIGEFQPEVRGYTQHIPA